MKILVIEDHPKLRAIVIKFFKLQWHTIDGVLHGKEGLEMLKQYDYDVIILDVNMPIMDGKKFLNEIRSMGNNIPVIAATSNSMLEHKLEMYDIGADDYIIKPFDLPELAARVQSLYKRKTKAVENVFTHKWVEVDILRHSVSKKGKDVKLGNKEFLILEFLLRNIWVPKNKTELLEYVWGVREQWLNFNSITLEMHISGLRKKLWKEYITTLKWVWYVIN